MWALRPSGEASGWARGAPPTPRGLRVTHVNGEKLEPPARASASREQSLAHGPGARCFSAAVTAGKAAAGFPLRCQPAQRDPGQRSRPRTVRTAQRPGLSLRTLSALASPALDPCEGATARSAGLSRTFHVCRTHCLMNLRASGPLSVAEVFWLTPPHFPLVSLKHTALPCNYDLSLCRQPPPPVGIPTPKAASSSESA